MSAVSGGTLGGQSLSATRGGPGLLVRVRHYLPTIAVFVGVLALWEILGSPPGAQSILPKPSAIASALSENWTGGRWPLMTAALSTLYEALGGLFLGTLAGVAVAFAAARWAAARGTLLPIGIAANAVPIIAFAPIINNWFGVLNPLSKMVIAALLVFFPIMINVTRGLSEVDRSALELMRSYGAGPLTVLRRVRIPNALPYFLTALKVATTLTLIGAIVGEYFGGSSDVLGQVIVGSASALRFEVTWAAILLGAATGIVFYLVTVMLERVLIPWHASVRSGQET